MNKPEIAQTVAAHLRPIIEGLCDHVAALTEGAPNNIVLIINAADVQQYASNVPRERGIAMISDVLHRWKVGLPDVLPVAVTPTPSDAFLLLLDQYCTWPESEHENAKHNLYRYVADLETKVASE